MILRSFSFAFLTMILFVSLRSFNPTKDMRSKDQLIQKVILSSNKRWVIIFVKAQRNIYYSNQLYNIETNTHTYICYIFVWLGVLNLILIFHNNQDDVCLSHIPHFSFKDIPTLISTVISLYHQILF